MSIKDKMVNAKTTDWLTKDISDLEVKWICWVACFFAAIELGIKKRLNKINEIVV